jgi:hypothetical protein
MRVPFNRLYVHRIHFMVECVKENVLGVYIFH